MTGKRSEGFTKGDESLEGSLFRLYMGKVNSELDVLVIPTEARREGLGF